MYNTGFFLRPSVLQQVEDLVQQQVAPLQTQVTELVTNPPASSSSSGVTAEELEPILAPYALKTELPIMPDLTPYALKTELPTVPDVSGLATKTEVANLSRSVSKTLDTVYRLTPKSSTRDQVQHLTNQIP